MGWVIRQFSASYLSGLRDHPFSFHFLVAITFFAPVFGLSGASTVWRYCARYSVGWSRVETRLELTVGLDKLRGAKLSGLRTRKQCFALGFARIPGGDESGTGLELFAQVHRPDHV